MKTNLKKQTVSVLYERVEEMKALYVTAKEATRGCTITCPTCRTEFVKDHHLKVFCSNQKTIKGGGSCKDQYWNTVDPNKASRCGIKIITP